MQVDPMWCAAFNVLKWICCRHDGPFTEFCACLVTLARPAFIIRMRKTAPPKGQYSPAQARSPSVCTIHLKAAADTSCGRVF